MISRSENRLLCKLQVKSISRLLLLLVALGLTANPAAAIGFRIPNQDAAAIARGNAFVATADNPSAIYYNPAGITQIEGSEAQLGVLNYLGINTSYEATGGGDLDTDFEVIPVPELYYVYSPKDSQFSFGVGAYAPFGLGVQWPNDPAMRPYALESRLQYLTFNPVVAWQAHPTLSFAVGPTINYSQILFTRGLLSPTDDYYKFKGTDVSFGFNAGVLWQPSEHWSFGANYRSPSTMTYDGDSHYSSTGNPTASTSTKARVPFPQIISAGISYRPTPKWNIEANIDYTDWNTLDTITLDGTRNIFGFDLPLVLNWNESWFYEFGVTRQFDNGWFASAGYFYCTETASDELFTPAIPDTVLHVGSIGVGHKGERWSWAVAAQIIAGPAREITSSPNSPDGAYQLFIPTLSFSVNRRF
jgi:long-chain fatty acid transport protein